MPGPLTTQVRSPNDPNEILLDDAEASVIVDDDDFETILSQDKGDEEIEDDE
jgi:hypothetical protein